MYSKIGQIQNTVTDISPYCRWFIPCLQDIGSGSALDKSSNNNSAVIGSGTTDASVWSNVGYATSGVSTNTDKGISVPIGALSWNGAAGQSLILSFQVKAAAPTAETWVTGDRSSGNGILMSVNTSGQPQILLRDGITSFTSGYSTNVSVFDGNAHTIVIYVDGILKTATAWADGTLFSNVNSTSVSSSLNGTTVSAKPFGYGHAGNPASNGCVAAQWRNLHAYVKPASIANISDIVARLLRDSFKPLSSKEL